MQLCTYSPLNSHEYIYIYTFISSSELTDCTVISFIAIHRSIPVVFDMTLSKARYALTWIFMANSKPETLSCQIYIKSCAAPTGKQAIQYIWQFNTLNININNNKECVASAGMCSWEWISPSAQSRSINCHYFLRLYWLYSVIYVLKLMVCRADHREY